MPEIDDTGATSLASARNGPSKLAKTATASDDCTLLGPESQSQLERAVLIVVERLGNQSREDRCLDETHALIYATDVHAARATRQVSRNSLTPRFTRGGRRCR